MNKNIKVATLENLDSVSESIFEAFPNGVVLLLNGELGSGKTAFVKNFVNKYLYQDAISPTYVVMAEYEGYGRKVYHYDIYNCGYEKFVALGLLEQLENDGFHFIEWPSEPLKKALEEIGTKFAVIDVKVQNNERIYEIYDERT